MPTSAQAPTTRLRAVSNGSQATVAPKFAARLAPPTASAARGGVAVAIISTLALSIIPTNRASLLAPVSRRSSIRRWAAESVLGKSRKSVLRSSHAGVHDSRWLYERKRHDGDPIRPLGAIEILKQESSDLEHLVERRFAAAEAPSQQACSLADYLGSSRHLFQSVGKGLRHAFDGGLAEIYHRRDFDPRIWWPLA